MCIEGNVVTMHVMKVFS